MTTTRKMPEFRRTDENGRLLPAYEVLVDGDVVGMVWKERVRHTRTNVTGRIVVGWTYSTEWRWSTRLATEFPTFRGYLGQRTRGDAVARLVAESAR